MVILESQQRACGNEFDVVRVSKNSECGGHCGIDFEMVVDGNLRMTNDRWQTTNDRLSALDLSFSIDHLSFFIGGERGLVASRLFEKVFQD